MNEAQTCEAPRSPGIEPRWTSSAKSGVGTALLACTRDLGLIVTGEHGFFSEEKRHAQHQIKSLARAIPAYDLVNTYAGHYRITKRIVSDPYRDVVLQRHVRGAVADGWTLSGVRAPRPPSGQRRCRQHGVAW